jgi:CheY-like chemotaxis protein
MKTILVIDDKDDVRSVVIATLTQSGFSTREARNGPQGLQLAMACKPDLILCDVNMPGMDGYHTLSAIREIPAISAVPFILMTGSVDKNGFRRGMVKGADDVLMKPFDADELIEAVMSRLVRQTQLEWEAYQRAEKLRDDAVHKLSQELAAPINGILGAVTSIMVEYAALKPEQASVSARQINESATRLNQLTQNWVH